VAIATYAAEAVIRSLADSGHLAAEPVGRKVAPSVEDAAKLLCRLSRTRRLDEPEEDWTQLRDSLAMVEYAWTAAQKAGIPPTDQADANAARAVLLTLHGVR
jgi:hypothetical protein